MFKIFVLTFQMSPFDGVVIDEARVCHFVPPTTGRRSARERGQAGSLSSCLPLRADQAWTWGGNRRAHARHCKNKARGDGGHPLFPSRPAAYFVLFVAVLTSVTAERAARAQPAGKEAPSSESVPESEERPVAPTVASGEVTAAEGRLLRLRVYLNEERSIGSTQRMATAIASFFSGSVLVATGIATHKQDNYTSLDEAQFALAAGFGVAGVAILLAPRPLEELASFLDRRRDAGGTSTEVLKDFEEEWRRKSSEARAYRTLSALGGMVLGGASIGVSMIFFVSSLTPDDVSRDQRLPFGATLVAVGSASLVSSVTSLFTESPLEASYRQYKMLNTLAAFHPPDRFAFSVAPSRGGATAQIAWCW